jgi:hypothetical protein
MNKKYTEEEIKEIVYKSLKPLGMLSHLNRLNGINWEKIDSTGKEKSKENKTNAPIWKVKKVDI